MKNLMLVASLVFSSVMARAETDVVFQEGNSYMFDSEVTEESVDAAITGLSAQGVKYLVLYTPGGNIDAGSRLLSYLKTRPDITCIVQRADSMGFTILQACAHRYVLGHSILMQHQATLGLPPTKIANLLSEVKSILAQQAELDTLQASRMKLSLKEFQKLVHDDLWIYSGSKAVELNAADKVISASCSPYLMAKKEVSIVKQMLMGMFPVEIKVEKSACPLILTKKVVREEPNDKEPEEKKSDK